MRRSLFLLAVLLLVVSVAGCGRGSFVGRRLDNFSAYYNTFYNAEKAFEEGVKAIEEGSRNEAVDQEAYLSLFGGEERPAQTKPFDDAIKKSSDVLREHPDSKWVDDALLLIGKAYFYLQNYVGAEQKFRELITLDAPLEGEADFWLGRTLIASQQFEEAAGHLQASLLREDLSKRWESMLRLALGELYVRRGQWDNATSELEAGLADVPDNDVAARAQFLLAQVYETLGRYDDAVAAYERVDRYNPFYELSYAARYSAVRVQGRHGDAEEALQQLRRMERDDKNYANRAELAYLRGRIYQAAGRPEDALDAYYGLLYDSDANISTVRGRTHYALGEFYRDLYVDYALAAAHFDTASTALGRRGGGGRGVAGRTGVPGGGQATPAPAAITDSEEQARVFSSFAEVEEEIAHLDSLLYLGSLDEEAFQKKVLALRQQRAEELAAQQAERERREAEQRFQAAGEGFRERDARGRNPSTGNTAASQNTGAAGFLFHKDPVRVQEGVADFEQRWGSRPLVPDWRRLAAIAGVGSSRAEGEGPIQAGTDTDLRGAGLPEVDVSAVPRDSVSRYQVRGERAVARYELGNVLFLSMNRPDSAASWYRMVVEEDSEEPVAQRAYYALAEVQRALGDTLASNRLYRAILTNYPASGFAGRARERLGLQAEDAVSDTLVLAETAYERAYAVWQRDEYQAALDDMLAVASRYSGTPVAPRALLAAGSIYQEWAARDSLALFDALPLSVPDSLLRVVGLLEEPSAPPEGSPPGAAADSLAVAPDTAAVSRPADSLAVAPDSAAVGRSADSSIAVVPDSAAVGRSADSSIAVQEPPVTEDEPSVRLETLYASLVDRYPRSPQASQASRILKALEERRAALEAPADSAAAPDSLHTPVADEVPPPDSADASPGRRTGAVDDDALAARRRLEDGVEKAVSEEARQQALLREKFDERQAQGQRRRRAAPDSLDVPEEASPEPLAQERGEAEVPSAPPVRGVEADDSSRVAADAAVPGDSVAAERPRRGDAPSAQAGAPVEAAPPERAREAWTIVVGSGTDRRRADALARRFRSVLHETGHAVAVHPSVDDGSTRYRIGFGLFASPEAAQEVRGRLAEDLPADAWILRVPPAPRTDPAAADSTAASGAARQPVRDVATADSSETDTPAGAAAHDTPSEKTSGDHPPSGWTVVIGSETSQERADALARRMRTPLLETDYDLKVVPSTGAGPTRYRVCLGFFATREEAQEVRGSLAEDLPEDAWVLRVSPSP